MRKTLAISTYNRKEIIEICSKFLEKENLLEYNLRIYDDKSSEYDEEFLKKIYKSSIQIIRNSINYKADKNMYMIYKDFLEKNDEFLIQLDSDMLISDDFFKMTSKIIEELKKEEAVYSLYNSDNHNFYLEKKKKVIGNEIFMKKNHIGGACVIFPRSVVEKIIKNIKIFNNDFSNYDWRWSEYLGKEKIPIYVSQKSFVQHLGYGGQNNKNLLKIDIGLNFCKIRDIEKANYLLNYYEKLFKKQKEYISNLSFLEWIKIKYSKNAILKKIYRYIILVFKKGN